MLEGLSHGKRLLVGHRKAHITRNNQPGPAPSILVKLTATNPSRNPVSSQSAHLLLVPELLTGGGQVISYQAPYYGTSSLSGTAG